MPKQVAELLPADFTLSFNCLGEVPLVERVAAAREAGFTSIGLSCRWMRLWLQEHSLDEAEHILGDMRVGELEALRILRADPDPLEDTAAALAERFRPDRLQVVGPYEGSLEDAAIRAARVADRFSTWGVDVVLEPLPFTNIDTPAVAADIIRRADRANLGMCLDIWHLYRRELALDHLDGLWDTIATLQINDGTLLAENPDLYQDCLTNRRPLGSGEFDLTRLLGMWQQHRPDASFSIEVISGELRSQNAATTAQVIADSITELVGSV